MIRSWRLREDVGGTGTTERAPRAETRVGERALLQKELVGERMSQTITVWKVSPGSLVK